MKIRVFQYPLPAPPELEDLNAYMARERVSSVSHHVVTTGHGGAMLLFVVESAGRPGESGPIPAGDGAASAPAGPKVDYQQLLPPEEFAVFSDLREARKRAAAAENVPVYSVFSNEHLAQMVKSKANTPTKLRAIPGIAEGKVGKYGEAMLAVLARAYPEGEAAS